MIRGGSPVPRLLLVLLLLVLAPSAGATRAEPPVSVFYYPWYGTPAVDGAYEHWPQGGHLPPSDIASDFTLRAARTRARTRVSSTRRCGSLRPPAWGRSSARGGAGARSRTSASRSSPRPPARTG